MKQLKTQPDQKRPTIRSTTMKKWITAILFVAVTALVEYLVVLYAMGLGLNDPSVLLWSFQFPGTGWPVSIGISLIFHLVPICIIVALAFSWTHLTRKLASKRQEIRKGKVETSPRQTEKKGLMVRISHATRTFSRRIKSRITRTKGISYLSQRLQPARATIKSALIVLLAFVAFILLFSLLAYPQLIYLTVSHIYQTNPSLLNFVVAVDNWANGFTQALGPIGWLITSINNGLRAAAPGVGNVGTGLGNVIAPLATLDNAGKYLVFQNAAAWISVLVIIIYGERAGKSYRYKK